MPEQKVQMSPITGVRLPKSCFTQSSSDHALRRVTNSALQDPPSSTLGLHFSMLHSSSAALDWGIAEQQAVLPPEYQPLQGLALHEVDCALLARDLAMRARCSVVVVGAQLD